MLNNKRQSRCCRQPCTSLHPSAAHQIRVFDLAYTKLTSSLKGDPKWGVLFDSCGHTPCHGQNAITKKKCMPTLVHRQSATSQFAAAQLGVLRSASSLDLQPAFSLSLPPHKFDGSSVQTGRLLNWLLGALALGTFPQPAQLPRGQGTVQGVTVTGIDA